MTLKIGGGKKKTEGRTVPKSRGGSLAVATYLSRGSAPPYQGYMYSHSQTPNGTTYQEH